MYCPKCGDEINYKSKYCRKCGTKLPYNMEFNKDKNDFSQKVNSHSNKKIILLAVLGLIVIIALFSFAAFNSTNHSSTSGRGYSSVDDFINNNLRSSSDEEVEYSYYPSREYDVSYNEDNASDFWGTIFGESQRLSGENHSL